MNIEELSRQNSQDVKLHNLKSKTKKVLTKVLNTCIIITVNELQQQNEGGQNAHCM